MQNEIKLIGEPGCSVGNGVLATICGKTCFFTAAHVVKKLQSIYIDGISINVKDSHVYYTENIWTKILCVLFGRSK